MTGMYKSHPHGPNRSTRLILVSAVFCVVALQWQLWNLKSTISGLTFIQRSQQVLEESQKQAVKVLKKKIHQSQLDQQALVARIIELERMAKKAAAHFGSSSSSDGSYQQQQQDLDVLRVKNARQKPRRKKLMASLHQKPFNDKHGEQGEGVAAAAAKLAQHSRVLHLGSDAGAPPFDPAAIAAHRQKMGQHKKSAHQIAALGQKVEKPAKRVKSADRQLFSKLRHKDKK